MNMLTNFKQSLEALAENDKDRDKNLPCLKCDKKDLKKPLYDRDLGGPYCSVNCLQEAGFDAMFDSRYLKK